MKNPFEEYRAFSAYLVAIPTVDAMAHLWKCFREGGKDNMAFYLADYYQVQPYHNNIEDIEQALETIMKGLYRDAKNYDLSGFEFIEKENSKC